MGNDGKTLVCESQKNTPEADIKVIKYRAQVTRGSRSGRVEEPAKPTALTPGPRDSLGLDAPVVASPDTGTDKNSASKLKKRVKTKRSEETSPTGRRKAPSQKAWQTSPAAASVKLSSVTTHTAATSPGTGAHRKGHQDAPRSWGVIWTKHEGHVLKDICCKEKEENGVNKQTTLCSAHSKANLTLLH